MMSPMAMLCFIVLDLPLLLPCLNQQKHYLKVIIRVLRSAHVAPINRASLSAIFFISSLVFICQPAETEINRTVAEA